MTDYRCPICDQPMRQLRKGATLNRRGPAYICPLDEAETWADENGHLHRFENATHHPPKRVWSEDELNRVQTQTSPTRGTA